MDPFRVHSGGPDRSSEKSIEERINEGADPGQFMPTAGDRDMITAFKQSQARRMIYYGEPKNARNDGTRRSDWERPAPENVIPAHVIDVPIEVEVEVEEDGVKRAKKYTWDYKTHDTKKFSNSTEFRRVFIIKDEGLLLDIRDTLSYLSASEGTGRHEIVKAQLEAELSYDNVNNQIIMQVMYQNIQDGKQMLPRTRYHPRGHGKKKDKK